MESTEDERAILNSKRVSTVPQEFDDTKGTIPTTITSTHKSVVSSDSSDFEGSRTVRQAPIQAASTPMNRLHEKSVQRLLDALFYSDTRSQTILDLCRNINRIPHIGLIIYQRSTVMSAILMEIIRHYPTDSDHSLESDASEVICAIVALLQQTVLCREVRLAFLSTYTLNYLHPYLQQTAQTREAEQLRVGLLGLFATAASKVPVEVMERYLICVPSTACSDSNGKNNERIQTLSDVAQMDSLYDHTVAALGTCTSEVGKTMALVLLSRLLSSRMKLAQIGSDPRRFQHLISNLNSVITYMAQNFKRIGKCGQISGLLGGAEADSPSWTLALNSFDRAKRLFRFTIDCLCRLAEESRMRLALRACLPFELRSRLFTVIFDNDPEVDQWLEQLWSRMKVIYHTPIRITNV